jgi:acyl-coenzyme A synthetase/AMP-(fatty) acid ligase/thioesterase domain-containing protein/acyl carrier protein
MSDTALTDQTGTASRSSLALRELAAERPTAPAVLVDEACVTYEQLNREADQLAYRLADEYPGGSHIALRTAGTHATAVGFLAIQRAGMVSVPVDPTAPRERVQTILTDVEASLLLSDIDGDDEFPLPTGQPLFHGAEAPADATDRYRGELASIVYTSGSTGTPKGIMLGREQIEGTLSSLPDVGIAPGARVGGLVAGTVGYIERLVDAVLFLRSTLVSYEIRRLGLVPLGAWMARERIVAFATVPTVMRSLLSTLPPDQRFADLRVVVLSGETSTWEDVEQIRRHLTDEAVIVNAFGLTETAGIASLTISADTHAGTGPLPAGVVSPDVKLTIVDETGKPAAAGDPGEIVVESPRNALGYWKRADLTNSAFTELPNGARRVRTGDGGRIRPDGMLDHLGRLDHLVKVSGNRVEFGEVEAALSRLDGVAAAAVATYIDASESTRITACVAPSTGAALDGRALRSGLSRQLPGYMIPDHIAVVDVIPQLPGGKTDRAAVAALRTSEQSSVNGQPSGLSPLESTLREIWSDVLGVKVTNVNDDFFELGGDSMRATRMFIELERRCGIDRPMSLIAEAPTIASLALLLGDESTWNAPLAVQTEGSRPPIFFIHDGAGSLSCGRAMATELGSDQPLYGIRCSGLNGAPVRVANLEELAATYIDQIRSLYPHGPYTFFGASLGGLIAMEMARQLKEHGEEVPFVALGDSTAPVPPAAVLAAARAQRSVRENIVLTVKRQVAYRWRRLGSEARDGRRQQRAVDRAVAQGHPIPVFARGRHVMRVYGALLLDYHARGPFPDRVLLLRAGGPDLVPDRGWNTLVADRLQIVDVPGTHPDLGRESSSSYVGPVLAKALANLV